MAEDVRAYILRRAAEEGFDPAAVMAIVMGEGGVTDPTNRSRAYDASIGGREESIGPFQLNMRGGLGERLLKERGIDVRDPANVYKGIDYALERAKVEGWIPWLNTMNKLGYDKWTGIKGQGGSGVRHVGGAGSKNANFAAREGVGGGDGGYQTTQAPLRNPGQYDLTPEKDDKDKKSRGDQLGEALASFVPDDLGMGTAPQQPPAEYFSAAPAPSFARSPFQPVQAPTGGGGGGMDLRALLTQLMQQQGGGGRGLG